MGARTIVKGVCQTLQRTPLRQWLSLEPPRCYVPPTVRTWTPQEWRDNKKDARLALRDRRQAFLASEDRRRLQIHSVKVTANKLSLFHHRKTWSIAQHMNYVKRVSSTGLADKGKNVTILPILLAGSRSVGPTWERARLLVDSGSEHPPLISQSLADRMGLRGPLTGGSTQANGEYLPLYDVGQLHMGLNGRTVTDNFLSAPLSHYDIILGESWLQENSGIIDYTHGQLWQWTPTGIQKMSFDALPVDLNTQAGHPLGQHRILIPWIRSTPLSATAIVRV